MEDKKKQSLLRYIAIMFVVAFVLVLISLVGQTRSIGQLSESSASALQRAQELQDTNRELSVENEDLEDRIRQLEDQLADLENTVSSLETALTEAQTEQEEQKTAIETYEQLLSGDVAELNTEYLGPNGLETYENLTKEGNEQ
ncbi:MAG: hypothetical protein J6J43_01515 [Oscillospiraceae bacterium]|nr:hypothetical protein [Oscillospiraceae bacterium]